MIAVRNRLKQRSTLLVAAQQAVVTLPGRQWALAIRRTLRASQGRTWGWFPALGLVSALGLLLTAMAYTGSRSGASWAELLFWIGLLVAVLPIAVRLISVEASRVERLGLLAWLGLALYIAKVMHSPIAFTFADELIHAGSANVILQSGHLFSDIPMLPAISYYPGLETVTTALASLTGLTVYDAGAIVLAAARLVLILALFLLYEQVSRSARFAGIATLLYMGNSNFMFWGAQFSYESLALPLGVLVIYAVLRRENGAEGRLRRALTVTALIALSTVVVTHHLTSYALVIFLWAVIAVSRVLHVRTRMWDVGLFSLAAVLFWLVSIASITLGYLSPVISRAVTSTLQLIAGEEASRELFRSASGYLAPLWERLTAIGSALIVALALPFSTLRVWRHHRNNPVAPVLTAAALAYCGSLLLRFSPAAWEIGNRASEFLFLGVAYVAAIAVVELWMPQRIGWRNRAAFAACAAIVFMGGVIAGWPPSVRLPPPYVVSSGTVLIEPPGVTAARWAHAYLGPENRMAADESNARLMLVYGQQYPLTGKKDGVKAMIFSGQIGRGEREIFQVTGVRYVILDRRLRSWDAMAGLYFDRTERDANDDENLMDPETYLKFDQNGSVSRVLDNGAITIYDVGALNRVPSSQ